VTVRRAAVTLSAACLFLVAADAALAKSRRHKHHKRTPSGEKAGAGGAAEGKSHLKRANALAGEGDCKAAIEEYSKAYDLLDDPVVLFNRGECYRRTGDGENAVDDYREFLERVPSAPNRADVEAKILALDAPEPAARTSAADAKTPPPLKPAETPAPKVAETRAPPPPPIASPPSPDTKFEPAVAIRTTAPAEDAGPGGGPRPWVWIALTALAVGAAVGSYLVFRPHDEPTPNTPLGNYRF
jgi:tetratricopeptide (TPR) repeat protein